MYLFLSLLLLVWRVATPLAELPKPACWSKSLQSDRGNMCMLQFNLGVVVVVVVIVVLVL